MKKNLRRIKSIFALVVLFGSFNANAVMISLFASPNVLELNENFTLDVVISDLGTGMSPSVGAFDIDVLFNNSVLQFNSATIGDGLDSWAGIFFSATEMGGTVSASDTALDDEATIDANQPDSFVLFSLNFTALLSGTTELYLDIQSISNTAGTALINDFQTMDARVSVLSDVNVPEPSSFLLLLLGLAWLLKPRKQNLYFSSPALS